MGKLLKKAGFTMVELIVVVAIIGVLAAILVPTMLGYALQSRITSANRAAAEIQKTMNTFLTEANTQKYGMFISRNLFTEGEIEISAGEWTITVDDPSVFVSTGSITWSGSGRGKADTPLPSGAGAEDILAKQLAEKFKTVESGYVAFYLEGGSCRAVLYTSESETCPPQVPAFGSGGWSADTYVWDSNNAGVSADGYIIGTSPVLELDA